MKYLVTFTCNDTSEIEVDANSEEEVRQKIVDNKLWDKVYPCSINQTNSNIFIDKLD